MSNAAELEALRSGRIFVAGHRGMVGSAIVRALSEAGCHNLVLRTRAQLDLRDQAAVDAFFENERPDYVFLAAAKVGGINANNSYPADFIYDNIMIATNVIAAAHHTDCKRLLFLGSSCIYPKRAPQPIPESALLTGPLEPTNEPYAIAKIAGIKLCESFARQYNRDFRSVMPANLYGPGDNYDLATSHVLPALIRKFHEAAASGASTVEVWGTGTPRREFLHVTDLADACLFVMTMAADQYRAATTPMSSHLNVGTGSDVTIRELAELIASVTGFTGTIVFNTSFPDGTPRKLLDVSTLSRLGWQAKIPLGDGVRQVVQDYIAASSSAVPEDKLREF
jgi:GDP-L-fucose synthase